MGQECMDPKQFEARGKNSNITEALKTESLIRLSEEHSIKQRLDPLKSGTKPWLQIILIFCLRA